MPRRQPGHIPTRFRDPVPGGGVAVCPFFSIAPVRLTIAVICAVLALILLLWALIRRAVKRARFGRHTSGGTSVYNAGYKGRGGWAAQAEPERRSAASPAQRRTPPLRQRLPVYPPPDQSESGSAAGSMANLNITATPAEERAAGRGRTDAARDSEAGQDTPPGSAAAEGLRRVPPGTLPRERGG